MISIIVPVYNAAAYIEQTVKTVLQQTYTDWELLLVDDCSTDNSVEIIKLIIDKYEQSCNDDKQPVSKIRLIEKKQNEGAAMARNTGLSESRGRYIAYLDADDIWYPEKLDTEFAYMNEYGAGFVFTAYNFGDENAVASNKIVRVPKTLTYKEALSRTIIFTSTVLFDTEKVDKNLLVMPNIGSEDTATWWRILKTGIVAYGLNKPLTIYRRPASSLSSNKKVAIKRIWNLYTVHEGLNPFISFFYLIAWAIRATLRRVIDDRIRMKLK